MPPTMTSLLRSSPDSSGSVATLNGTIPRRQPLRRLYPLQRPRSQSETLILDENIPTSVLFLDAGLGPKRRSVRSSSVSSSMSLPPSFSDKVVQRFGSPDRHTEGLVYSRPPLLRRESDVGPTAYSYRVENHPNPSACPVHGDRTIRKGSILKRATGRTDRRMFIPKQVQFCPNVHVVRMDEDGKHIGTHIQDLCGEKRKRFGTLTRQNTRGPNSLIYLREVKENVEQNPSRPSTPSTGAKESKALQELFKRVSAISAERDEENRPVKRGQYNITFSNRPNDGTKLRFTLYMGQEYDPNDIVVKANTTGSRIRVMASRTDSNCQVVGDFNERYVLPMDIDPYKIEARLDKWGQLTVVAPLMTMEKRQENHKSDTALSGIYV